MTDSDMEDRFNICTSHSCESHILPYKSNLLEKFSQKRAIDQRVKTCEIYIRCCIYNTEIKD